MMNHLKIIVLLLRNSADYDMRSVLIFASFIGDWIKDTSFLESIFEAGFKPTSFLRFTLHLISYGRLPLKQKLADLRIFATVSFTSRFQLHTLGITKWRGAAA